MGIFGTDIKIFPPVDKIPHMGWNNFLSLKGALFNGINTGDNVYYVHSYYAEICSDTIATCEYILPFSAAFQKGNFYATQFHPEKSGSTGEIILDNFLKRMRIIMAIDIMGGKCVRLTRGDFNSQKIYNDDPLEVALEIEASGIRYLHLVDLDGAKARRVVNLAILEKIAGRTNLKIDFGGGIRKTEDLRNLFNAGASQVTAGSIAVTNKTLFLTWLREFGADKMILGADSFSGKVSSVRLD
jgi:hypothetical protein